MSANLKVNVKRLSQRIQELAKVGALPNGGVSRLALTHDDKEGRDLVLHWMKRTWFINNHRWYRKCSWYSIRFKRYSACNDGFSY